MKQGLFADQCAFTLLELLITLTIAAILTGLAIPAFSDAIKRTNSRAIASQLIGLVNYARTVSITTNQNITLCGSSDGVQCNNDWSKNILLFIDSNDNGEKDPEDTLLRSTVLFKNGETLVWKSFRNKPYLQLHPTGITYFQNGNFTYCPADGDLHYAVHWILNVNGHLRSAKDKNGDGIPDQADGSNISC